MGGGYSGVVMNPAIQITDGKYSTWGDCCGLHVPRVPLDGRAFLPSIEEEEENDNNKRRGVICNEARGWPSLVLCKTPGRCFPQCTTPYGYGYMV